MVAGGAGVLLLISLFLPWVGLDLPAGIEGVEGASGNLSGWEVNNPFDIVLVITAAAGIGAAFGRGFDLPGISVNGAAALLGLVGAIAILWFLIDPPAGLERKLGLFLALIAACGVAYGGFSASQEEGRAY
jgi:hypothetical protein